MTNEKEHIKSVQSGNVRAFSELVDSHKNMVYSLVLKMVKSSEDAEEVAQDSFVKAFKAIKQFKGESKFSTWLYKIAYFTAINHLRKNKMLTSEVDMSTFQSDDKNENCTLNYCDSIRIGSQNQFLFNIPPYYSLKYIGNMNESPFDILNRIDEINVSSTNGNISARNDGVIQLFSVNENSYTSIRQVWVLKW